MTFNPGDIVNNGWYNFEITSKVAPNRYHVKHLGDDLESVNRIGSSIMGHELIPGKKKDFTNRELTFEEINRLESNEILANDIDPNYFEYLTLDNRIRLLTGLRETYDLWFRLNVISRNNGNGMDKSSRAYVDVFGLPKTVEDFMLLSDAAGMILAVQPELILDLPESDKVFITLGGTYG